MNINETRIEGTLTADGTLELDEKPNLPAGRVTVVLRSESPTPQEPPLSEGFWQMMEGIWQDQRDRKKPGISVQEVASEHEKLRDEVEREIESAMQLQRECQQQRTNPNH